MKRILAGIIIILMFCLMLSSCSMENNLIGDWVLTDGKCSIETITFYGDGTCIVDKEETGNWQMKNGTLRITGTISGMFVAYPSIVCNNVSISGDRLTLNGAVLDGDSADARTLVYVRD